MIDVTVLRSRLVFILGDELKNLTTTDLKECSFRTSRLVFSCLVLAGHTLQEEAERLNLINDSRARKLGLLRNQTDSRDDRKRVEAEYRHSFFEIILKALLDMQFPPALEPFSDTLGSLKDDVEFRLAAVQFLLDTAVVGAGGMTDMSQLSHNIDDSSCCSSERSQSQQSPRDFSFGEVPTEMMPPSSRKQQQQRQPRRPSRDMTPEPASFCPSPLPQPPGISTSSISSTPSISSSSVPFRQGDASESTLRDDSGRRQHVDDDYDALYQSYQVIQHHNEQLSKQLKLLHASVCQRNAMEVKMDLLMRDFSSMVSEIADISTAPGEMPSTESKSKPVGAALEGDFTSCLSYLIKCN